MCKAIFLVFIVVLGTASAEEFYKERLFDKVENRRLEACQNWFLAVREGDSYQQAYMSGKTQAYSEVKEMIYPNPLYEIPY